MNEANNKSGRPNVLLLTVDTLRADRLGVYGYGRPTTPCLEKFARNATVCERAFTLGPFTQIACIQLFTSSRPLSYGGYDRGALGRPNTVFKRFRDAGYYTSGLSTIHWVSPYYGYTDGLDDETSFFLLNTLVGMAVNNMRDTLRVYFEKVISAEEMMATAVPVIRRMFDNVDAYCDELKGREREFRMDFPDSKVANDGYDYDKVKNVVARHRSTFENDPLAYIHTHLGEKPDAHQWLAADWHLSRRPAKLIGEAAFRLSNRLLGLVDPRLAGMRANRFRLSVDAHAIAGNVVGQLNRRSPDKPFFIWAHFKDTHQPFVSGPGRKWYRHTPDYLAALGHPRDLDPSMVFRTPNPRTEEEWSTVSALYDAAVRSTDEAIGRILDALEAQGLADNTVVAICGDHGEEIGEHGAYGHQCMHYEHNSRIPMLFRAPGQRGENRTDALVSSLDWAPTVADLAGIDPHPGWEGHPVTSPAVAGRRHVLMETFCRGNCDFPHRPVYMGVRTDRYKYIWKEYQDPAHKIGTLHPELYDLHADPAERTNIFSPDHPRVAEFNAIIADRLDEIPEISPERVARLAPAEKHGRN